MTPEPGHRTRRRYNETRPLTIRVGAIRDELDARSDGTEAGYRAVIMRDLKRYYSLLAYEQRPHLNMEAARAEYDAFLQNGTTEFHDPTGHDYADLDALERAHILVTHAGLTVDAALVSVGLVKEEK